MVPAAAVQLQPVTADELLAMPDDGLRRELIEGPRGKSTGPLPRRSS